MENNIVKWWVVGISAFVALLLLIGFFPLVQVDATERAVVLRLGKIEATLEPGLHVINPFIEDIKKMDVTIQKEEVNASSASKDLQNVSATIALNFRLDPSAVATIWERVRTDYQVVLIDPAIQEAVKAATAKYTAEELVTKREAVKDEIKLHLTERLARDHILVTEVSIVNFEFSKKFDIAIEAKVTAEQKALEAKNKLEQVKYEAAQKVATAEAEARSIRLQSDAANNEKYVSLKALEVQLEFAKHWNGQYPTTYIVSGEGSSGPIQVIPLPAVK